MAHLAYPSETSLYPGDKVSYPSKSSCYPGNTTLYPSESSLFRNTSVIIGVLKEIILRYTSIIK